MNDCSNRNGAYLKAHAEIECEGQRSEAADVCQHFEDYWTGNKGRMAPGAEAFKSMAQAWFIIGFCSARASK